MNINKLERMTAIEDKLQRVPFVDQQRLRALMLVWEQVEDGWQNVKDRISNLFMPGRAAEKPSLIVERVRTLLTDRGLTLRPTVRDELERLAENVSGESVDFASFQSIRSAMRSRMQGGTDGG